MIDFKFLNIILVYINNLLSSLRSDNKTAFSIVFCLISYSLNFNFYWLDLYNSSIECFKCLIYIFYSSIASGFFSSYLMSSY